MASIYNSNEVQVIIRDSRTDARSREFRRVATRESSLLSELSFVTTSFKHDTQLSRETSVTKRAASATTDKANRRHPTYGAAGVPSIACTMLRHTLVWVYTSDE